MGARIIRMKAETAMDPIAYYAEPNDLAALEHVTNRLYGDGTPLSADERRDLANAMRVIVDRIRNAPVPQ